MADQSVADLKVYNGWQNYQNLIIVAIQDLSDEQLATRPASGLRSIGENVAHLVGTRVGWLYYNLKRGVESLLTMAEWYGRPDQPAHSAAEMIKGLETTWQVIEDALNEWTINDLQEPVVDTDENDQEYTVTRQWVLWHLIEHDMHHGGEISATLGILGLPGIDARYTNHG